MADSNATPALYKLPLELVSAICSFSDVASLDSISRASKACRQLFAPHLLEEVRFDGSQASLTCLLRGFLLNPADAPVVGLRDHIKCATIVVHSSPATWRKAANFVPDVQRLSMQILDSIQLMGNLHTLALDLELLPDEQVIDLAKALRSTEPWRLRHLRVAGHGLLGPATIEHCCPDTLKILQISEGIDSVDYIAAAKHCKGLERLQIFAGPEDLGKSLENIATHFRHLQWLVISDRREYSDFIEGHVFMADEFEYDELIGQLETILKQLPRLRYFAFSLRPNTVHEQLMFPDAVEGPPDLFYDTLIDRVSNTLPKLRQLCVMIEWPNVWRGVRTEDGQAMYTEYEYIDETAHFNRVFPVGLGE